MRDWLNDCRWHLAAILWTCAALCGTRWPTMAARCDRWATNLEDSETHDEPGEVEWATFLTDADEHPGPWQVFAPADLTPLLEQARRDVSDLAKATDPRILYCLDEDPTT